MPGALEAYGRDWAAQDIYAQSGHPSVTQQGARAPGADGAEERSPATPYYNEFMRPYDLFHSVVATLLADERTSADLRSTTRAGRRCPTPSAWS